MLKVLQRRCAKQRSVDASLSTKKADDSHASAGHTFFTALLPVALLLAAGLSAPSADASLLIMTSGTILSGSETGGLFGLPAETTDLTGQRYTLMVEYDDLGPNYITNGDGSFAEDTENAPGMTGYVVAIVNGHSVSTALTNSLGSSLIEDTFDFNASNEGFNGAPSTGAFVNVLQGLSCNDACVPYADLMRTFSYLLTANDFGMDLYTFEGGGFPAAGTPTASFTGAEARFALIPEPATPLLAATALLAIGLVARRRRA